MKKLHVFSPYERPQAGMLKELLDVEGIHCLLRNDQLSTAIGEIPFVECSPELWVIDDEVYPRARLFLDAWLKSDTQECSAWTCPSCGENCERQFNACWSCGTQRE
jgi:Putative prokaryotic signal transducing protein